jgi:serine protease Do
MALPTDILRYFHPERIITKVFTFGDFLQENSERVKANELNIIIQKLRFEGLLINRGDDEALNPLNTKYQTVNFDEETANYGGYDFMVKGFPFIRETFNESVFLFLIKFDEGEQTVGTGFLVGYRGNTYVITARHNVFPNREFKIQTFGGAYLVPKKLWITFDRDYEPRSDGLIDVAIIKVKDAPIKTFMLSDWNILDEILTIGYPPVPGFDAVRFSETASIVAVKSTTGQITGEGMSHVGKQDFFLISARVKGGNSGGPVINKAGKTVGIVTNIPAGGTTEDGGTMDTMGYGVVTPSETIRKMLDTIMDASSIVNIMEKEIKLNDDGWISVGK